MMMMNIAEKSKIKIEKILKNKFCKEILTGFDNQNAFVRVTIKSN